MNATSTENFHDIIAIDFELQTFPNPDVEDKFIVSATNRDDIFCFVFEGPCLRDACRNAGLFTGWEKDQKIRELEKKNDELTKTYDILDKTLDKTQKKCNEWYEKWVKWLHKYEHIKEEYKEKLDVLQRKYDLEKAANEAQHKFFVNYAGKGTEIEFNHTVVDDEVTYVIVDKDYIDGLRKGIHDLVAENTRLEVKLRDTANQGDYIMYDGSPYTPDDIEDLLTEIRKLKELKTPTIENFADEEPSTRRDILRCAEKCVCGQREQDYGTPESNFQLIADLWNDYLKKEGSSIVVDAKDVAMMMALMKIARIRNGGGSGDSFVDLAGYAACGGEIWHLKKETNTDSKRDTN